MPAFKIFTWSLIRLVSCVRRQIGVVFDELLAANKRYSETFSLAELAAPAARGLALLTCMDSRIEVLTMLGLAPGDAKIMRNAGGRALATCCGTFCSQRLILA